MLCSGVRVKEPGVKIVVCFLKVYGTVLFCGCEAEIQHMQLMVTRIIYVQV